MGKSENLVTRLQRKHIARTSVSVNPPAGKFFRKRFQAY